jgi:hypothetical protein
MSEHLLDHLDVGAARDREAGCGVAQLVLLPVRYADLPGTG